MLPFLAILAKFLRNVPLFGQKSRFFRDIVPLFVFDGLVSMTHTHIDTHTHTQTHGCAASTMIVGIVTGIGYITTGFCRILATGQNIALCCYVN